MKTLTLFLGALLALTPVRVAADSYVVRIGVSADTWEQSSTPTNECEPVAEELISLVLSDRMPIAVRRLEGKAYEALTDEEAASMLGIEVEPESLSLAAQILGTRIAILGERKRVAYSERRGSWSMRDEAHLRALNDVFANLEQRPLAPFLVRALAADAERVDRFDVAVCDSALQTRSFPTRNTFAPDHPDRVALIVLLAAAPQNVLAEWTYDDPDLNR